MPTQKKLKIEDLIACIDSREQLPLDLQPLRTITKKLDVADYSVEGLEDRIAIERKSLNDLVGCVGRERDRFERMLKKLADYEHRAIVVSADWMHIEMKSYHGTVHPNAVLGTVFGWAMSAGTPIMFMGDERRAGLAVARMLWVSANRCALRAK